MKTNKHVVSVTMEVLAICVKFIKDFRKASVSAPLLLVLYIDGMKKMPEMSGKHRINPTKDEKNNKLHKKVGRRHQANSNRFAQVMTAMSLTTSPS